MLRRWPVVGGMAAVFAFYNLAQIGLQNVWVLYTEHRYSWSELANGLSLALVGLGSAVVQTPITPRVIARWGERRAIVIGMLFSLASFIGYALAGRGWIFALMIVVGALAGIGFPATQSFIAGQTPAEHQGAVQGALTSLISLASIFAPLIATAIFGWSIGPHAPWYWPGATFWYGAVIIALALLLVRRLYRRHPVAVAAD